MPSKRSPKIPPTASFKSFSWLREDCQTADTDILELAKDIAGGVKLAVQLMENASLDADSDSRPYLNQAHCGILRRFVIASCETLDRSIDGRFEYLNDRSMKEADK